MMISPESDGSFLLTGKYCNITSEAIRIIVTDIPQEFFSFQAVGSTSGFIGTISGIICSDVAVTGAYKILRETFLSDNEELVGIRITIENISSTSFNLERIIPVSCFKEDVIRAADSTFCDWHILRMARNKNDIPGCFKPGVDDQDFKDASLDSSEIPAGMGVSEEDSEKYTKNNKSIVSEPCMFIKNQNAMNLPGLFISVLGQDKHLSQLVLTANMKQNSLSSFEAICEFDHVRIDPQEKRATHWVLFTEEQYHKQAIEKHNDMLAELYKPSPPSFLAPSIYCTWYFYGPNFSENDLDEALGALNKDKVPFDVFLLDDGWSDKFGSWQAGERFPGGMKRVADKITKAGYIPGIWTCPFVVTADSLVVKEHPELLARDSNGNPYEFAYQDPKCYAVDPTSPYAVTYFNQMYKHIGEWGFKVHKFDFLRSFLTTDNVRFYNRTINRAQAYRLGMQLVRNAIGDEPYILACGGLFEGTIGLVDGMRIGSDTRGFWQQDEYLNTIKQNVMRNNSNRFWHTDPDAAMLRLRSKPFRDEKSVLGDLSLGRFNEEEAFSIVVNQYLGGGMTCLSEHFADLQPERRALLRHIIPAEFPVPVTLDMFNPGCPTLFLSLVKPRSEELEDWWTLTIANWQPEPVQRIIMMSELKLPGSQMFILFEFKEQKTYGLKTNNDSFTLEIPPHGMRVMRIAPWSGNKPVIIGTDLHITGGAVELDKVHIGDHEILGDISTKWDYPVRITVAFPHNNGFQEQTLTVDSGTGKFQLRLEE